MMAASSRFFALLIAVLLNTGLACAEVIPVKTSDKSASPDHTMTFYFQSADPMATLVFIPGGDGYFPITPTWKSTARYFTRPFNSMLSSLSDPKSTSGRFNVVFFATPERLDVSGHWSGQRTDSDHLSRVEDVIRFYREKFGKPVWVMGHSMGSISLTYLHKRLQEKKDEGLVEGLIWSGGNSRTSFNYETTKLPVLIMHHEDDGCAGNQASGAKSIHAKLKSAGNTATELVLIQNGHPSGDPCHSGYHMYQGVETEATKALDQFMTKYTRAP